MWLECSWTKEWLARIPLMGKTGKMAGTVTLQEKDGNASYEMA